MKVVSLKDPQPQEGQSLRDVQNGDNRGKNLEVILVLAKVGFLEN